MECGNNILVSLIDRVWTESLGIRCYGIGDPNLLAIARKEHGQMIDLLRDGDSDGFQRCRSSTCSHHLRPTSGRMAAGRRVRPISDLKGR